MIKFKKRYKSPLSINWKIFTKNAFLAIVVFISEQLLTAFFLPGLKDSHSMSLLKIVVGVALFLILIAALVHMIQTDDYLRYQTTNRTLRKMKWSTLGKSMLIIPLLLLINAVTESIRLSFNVSDTSANQSTINQLMNSNNPFVGLYLAIIGIIFAPIIEEIIFRYIIINKVFDEHHQKSAIVTAIILFAGLHMTSDFAGTIQWASVIADIVIYGSMAIIFTTLYVKTDNLKYSITIHMTNNLISFIPMLIILIPKVIKIAIKYATSLT